MRWRSASEAETALAAASEALAAAGSAVVDTLPLLSADAEGRSFRAAAGPLEEGLDAGGLPLRPAFAGEPLRTTWRWEMKRGNGKLE